ncbi:exodeoxyribonuclease VII large subunit [Lysobacter pythonis]|uniref:Exodeoxyribonuclease 7 large subunit n=1 Tax=Solilutibacter pythonis TaxID=2483112 RepID=A0A3M2I1G7_9GAMM|nr:exodeoxyribonuclease VII large subunit [Lysobacter pythonis]RMH93032.1 exodeoxyribonuclease VII large subunit [Lysobacter pythonis]
MPHKAPADDIFSPSQLNTLARNLLEDTFPLIWVEGELGNVARPASGHLYLTLKDARAQVRAAMFKPKSTWLKFAPREGLRVLARGRVTLYEARGEYQLVLDHMEEAGEGALRRAFEALKAKLQAEGLFDTSRKRPLPPFARRIGVLTSPTGAAVRDVLSVLARRFPLLEVEVLPVPVQGETAAAQIRGMLSRAIASERYDVLLLARGGGSLEDLWAFNDEQLARAIAASPVPVVSAIGHETDFSLSDFAADLRAPTPSVAAELIAPDRFALAQRLQRLGQRAQTDRQHRLRAAMQRLDRARLRLDTQRPQARLALYAAREREARRRLDAALSRHLQHALTRTRQAGGGLRAQAPGRRLDQLARRLDSLRARPGAALRARLQLDRQRLLGLARALAAVSPLATVARGYAILHHEDGHLVRGVGDARAGDAIRAQLADGELRMRVEDGAG